MPLTFETFGAKLSHCEIRKINKNEKKKEQQVIKKSKEPWHRKLIGMQMALVCSDIPNQFSLANFNNLRQLRLFYFYIQQIVGVPKSCHNTERNFGANQKQTTLAGHPEKCKIKQTYFRRRFPVFVSYLGSGLLS